MSTASPYGAPIHSLDPTSLLRQPMANLALRSSGEVPDPSRPRIAVIGSRRATAAQLAAADGLTGWLTEGGAVIVSGGALGVDAAAHEGALRRGGATVAVLPGGLLRPSPQRHRDLYRRVVAHGGLLLSPFDDEANACVPAFHRRNSVICHLVDALVVVCADNRSGSMQCSRRAHDAGVALYAVPWSPGSLNSAGSNGILATAGRAICSRADVRRLLENVAGGAALPPARAQQLPLPGQEEPQRWQATMRRQSAATIDAEGRGRQTCAALGVPGDSKLEPPAESDTDLVAAIGAMLNTAAADGVSLEEAAQALGRPRGLVAETLLALGMSGQIRKTVGGRYRRIGRVSNRAGFE